MNMKKAISPLIATILLIVVAVALIAIVVAWGKSFTIDSLSDATGVVDTSCMGAAIQTSGCMINANDKMIFYVQNIGTVNFPAADDFILNIVNVTDGNSTLNLKRSQTETVWGSGIAPGQTAMFVIDDANFPGTASGRYDVKVVSSSCSADAVAQIKNCSK